MKCALIGTIHKPWRLRFLITVMLTALVHAIPAFANNILYNNSTEQSFTDVTYSSTLISGWGGNPIAGIAMSSFTIQSPDTVDGFTLGIEGYNFYTDAVVSG